MTIHKLILPGVLLLTLGCTQNRINTTRSPEQLNFYNFALSVCLGSGFEEGTAKGDFNKSANDYRARGHMSMEAYTALEVLVDQWLARDYPSQHGGGLVHSAKCLDFYHSTDLLNLYAQHNPCRSKASWLNKEEYLASCDAEATKSIIGSHLPTCTF